MSRGQKVWSLLLILLLLSGCLGDPTPEGFEDYVLRLSRSLDQSLAKAKRSTVELAAMPAPAELREPTAVRESIDLVDLIALNACELGQVVARRNSSLGKVSPPSQRLIYHLDFLRTAPNCISWLRDQGERELATALQAAWIGKRERLPQLIWQGLFTGQEFRAFWQRPHYLEGYPEGVGPELIAHITLLDRWVQQWLSGDYRVESRNLELLLAQIARGDGGRLIEALAVQSGALARANRLIDQRLARRPVCFAGKRSNEAEIFQNVVTRFWLGDLQRWSAAVNQRYFQLLPAIDALEQRLAPGEPAPYRHWRVARNDALAGWAAAPAGHIAAIKRIYAQCGLLPAS